MPNAKMTLVDWLDDLCVRFIVNLPNEELQSVERICFQIEEAQWFYEDFIRPLDPNNLPSMHLRKFSQLIFQHCPLFSAYSEELHQQAYEQFLAYKTRVPVRGAIMLNQDMTCAVLVKGWKKGAKWSFPRGKINKEEADLDCAVREVYEETGFDLRKADLVQPDEQMKKITVTMREQSMMLYVFRGVPMDAYFEPRTRKEISKIDWYKLTDLPILRRKTQIQQQGLRNDLIKESSFYMVAPFLGPLKSWIKQQHKFDRQKTRSSAYLVPPVAITDDEDHQSELYETTANEAAPVAKSHSPDNFADMVARLGRHHRPSDTLPELSMQPQTETETQHPVDPAAELKRLLSVGVGIQSPPVEAPNMPAPNQTQANTLLALFQQGNSHVQGPQVSVPQTPFDQIMPPPIQPRSPHGQHRPRPPHIGSMDPPPPFAFPPHPQDLPIRGLTQYYNGMPTQIPPQFMQPQSLQMGNLQTNPPNMQQAFDQRNQRPPFQLPADSHFTGAQGRPAIPPASNLPAPKLTAHTLGLLNTFKVNDANHKPGSSSTTTVQAQTQQSSQTTPRMQHPLPQHRPHDLASPQGLYAPSPPQFRSPPVHSNFQPEQPKPRTTHQDSLLNLFSATPPVATSEPAELSAHPRTPGYVSAQPVAKSSRHLDPALLEAFGTLPKISGITSATVSGPVNAPDFDTMKKNKQQPVSASSRGSSPATQMPFMPQQILKRGQTTSVPRSPLDVTSAVQNSTSQIPADMVSPPEIAFQPQVLKRPQQQQNATPAPATNPTAHAQGLLSMFKASSPKPAQLILPVRSPAPPVIQSSTDRRESIPNEQKSALLALFGSKPSPAPQPSHSPIPQTHSPLPPTPKTRMSGVISPVSPLPTNGSPAASPAHVASRSRISSIGDSAAQTVTIPPTSHPVGMALGDEGAKGGVNVNVNEGGLSAQGKVGADGKSPVDKTFLLGFLEDVARRGR